MIQIRSSPPPATLDSPIEHLNACHRRIEERLQTLERAGAALAASPADALAAIQAVFWFFDTSGAHHTADEEESFFPRLLPNITADERLWLEDLQQEHTRAEALYDSLKTHVAAMATPPGEAAQARFVELAQALCSLYRQHIANEDARFPSLAARALSPVSLDAITQEMKLRRGI